MLTPCELEKLTAGLTDLSDWGSQMLSPFAARRLRNASVTWINARWFLERGLDVTAIADRRRVEEWLLHEFAFAVPLSADPANAWTHEEKTFHADRYGGSGRTPHGGSGRVGTLGMFQIKGIGMTPLVSRRADWVHAHGCLWMEEAIREAIFAEVACMEFPHGAIPVIAILDSGLNYMHADASIGERRALLVRPAMLRMAHLQRSPMFVCPRDSRGGQLLDVARTRGAVDRYEHLCSAMRPDTVSVQPFPELIERVIEQIAFGQVHRLCYGGYFSSNLSLSGALLDFGAMRSLPDWAGAIVNEDTSAFGSELVSLREVIESISYYLRKYGLTDRHRASPEFLFAKAKAKLHCEFDRQCAAMWKLDGAAAGAAAAAAEIVEIVRAYFSAQQKTRVKYNEPFYPTRPWLFDAVVSTDGARSVEEGVLHAIDNVLRAHFHGSANARERRWLAWSSAARLLMPRPRLGREQLQSLLFDTVVFHCMAAPPDPNLVEHTIASIVSAARRDWRDVPANLCIRAQVSRGYSSALLCEAHPCEHASVWIEAVRVGGYVRIFDSATAVEDLSDFNDCGDAMYWKGRLPVARGNALEGLQVRLGGCHIQIPAMSIVYPPLGMDVVRARKTSTEDAYASI